MFTNRHDRVSRQNTTTYTERLALLPACLTFGARMTSRGGRVTGVCKQYHVVRRNRRAVTHVQGLLFCYNITI